MINGLSKSSQNFMQRILEKNNELLNKSMEKLASGKKINQASDDAAGLALIAKMTAQVTGEQQAAYNTQDSYSVAQVAEGAFDTVSGIQQRLRELAVQSANGTLTDEDRSLLQTEADQLVQELDRIENTVEFNGQKILNGDFSLGTGEFTTQAGADSGQTLSMNFEQINSTTLGLNNLDISTQSAASSAIEQVDSSINTVSSYRAELGAYQNRLESAYDFLGIQKENQMSALSRIQDTDYASEILNKTKFSLINDVSIAMLAQGNLLNSNVLALIK